MTTERIFNVADYGFDIQAALDAASPPGDIFLQRGGIVYMPRRQYVVNNPLIVRGGRLTLKGENLDTLIHPSVDNEPVIKLIGAQDGKVHDFEAQTFTIVGRRENSGNIGIYCKGEDGIRPAGFRFYNISMFNLLEGIYFENVDFPMFTRCGVAGSKGNGMTFKNTAQISMYHCFVQGNAGKGIHVEDALGFYFQGPGIENNGFEGEDVPNNGAWQLHAKNSTSVVVTRSDIERFVNGILLEGCRGVGITNNVFLPAPNLRGRQVTGVLVRRDLESAQHASGGVSAGVEITGNTFYGGSDDTHNWPYTTGVKVEQGSVLDITLLANSPASRGPARMMIYDYPQGRSLEGMNLIAQGPHTGDGGGSARSQTGLRLPALSDVEMNRFDVRNSGMVAYHYGSNKMCVNEGGRWKKVSSPFLF